MSTALNYAATRSDPARGIIVQAVDSGGNVLASDVTDASGNYSVTVAASTPVRIQARAQMQQTAGATWNIQVLDNQNSFAIYVLAGALADSGTANSTRNLNAASGWGTVSYTGTRAAAPFAILDSIYTTVTAIADVDANVTFPDLQVFWSAGNSDNGDGSCADAELGRIITSSYTRTNCLNPSLTDFGDFAPTILILGDDNVDTDEYDPSVIVHEFGHYFEDQLSRSDTIGNGHSLADRLDARLAFGEGWGNAFSAMILGDPVYRDSSGAQQSTGFAFSVEADLTSSTGSRPQGWYAEGSVQQILYDIFDSGVGDDDPVSGGLAPIYNAFTDAAYTSTRNFTTIFEFANQVRTEAGINGAQIDGLMTAEDIFGTGARGVGETNDAGLAQVLPVYKTATVGGGPITVCSTNAFSSPTGGDNKLGVYDYVTLTLPSTQSINIVASRTSGAASTNPNFRIWIEDRFIVQPAVMQSTNNATWSGTLTAGTYAIDFFDEGNTEGTSANASCFSFVVS
ncbi:MAG: hypothetical protein AAGL11_08700 [Pseudomonadota bacterium]